MATEWMVRLPQDFKISLSPVGQNHLSPPQQVKTVSAAPLKIKTVVVKEKKPVTFNVYILYGGVCKEYGIKYSPAKWAVCKVDNRAAFNMFAKLAGTIAHLKGDTLATTNAMRYQFRKYITTWIVNYCRDAVAPEEPNGMDVTNIFVDYTFVDLATGCEDFKRYIVRDEVNGGGGGVVSSSTGRGEKRRHSSVGSSSENSDQPPVRKPKTRPIKYCAVDDDPMSDEGSH